ncbi:MAG: VWA domain-containing protein, partial [Planctomycetaceae bacterium]|nr:VWA domain-containing protein [Planctomycetaceae bacterium]
MRRLPVYILVDCSVSMKGEAIEAVKVGLDKLLSSLRRDPYALESVYVSLIAYGNDANVLVTLTELSDFQLPEITLAESSNRNLGQAIELLCQRYDEEVRKTTTEQKG